MQIKLFLFAFVERKNLICNYEKREHKKQKSPKIHQKYFVSLCSLNLSVNFAYRVQCTYSVNFVFP